MSVVSRLARHFGRGVRHRGDDYQRLGNVLITSGTPARVEATVKGTERYKVSIELDGAQLSLSCSCPYIESMGEPCKHLWATILQADLGSNLSDIDKAPGLKVTLRSNHYVMELSDQHRSSQAAGGQAQQGEQAHHGNQGHRHQHSRRRHKHHAGKSGSLQVPEWKANLLRVANRAQHFDRHSRWPAGRVIYYVFGVEMLSGGDVSVDVCFRERKTDGTWGKLRAERLPDPSQFTDPDDRQILSLLAAPRETQNFGGDMTSYNCPLNPEALEVLLPKMCATGRCLIRTRRDEDSPPPLTWDDGPAWQFRMRVLTHEMDDKYQLIGVLQRGEETVPVTEITLPLHGIVIMKNTAARMDDCGAFQWLEFLHAQKQPPIPRRHGEEFLETLMNAGKLPPLELPEELRVEQVVSEPRPRLTIRPKPHFPEVLTGELLFDYSGLIVGASDPLKRFFQREQRRVIIRNEAFENRAVERLRQVGFRDPRHFSQDGSLELHARQLSRVVTELLAENWLVNAEGKTYRSAGRMQLEVASGIDWFELRGGVDFDGARATFPALLEALEKGERLVPLSDGSIGMLPEEWLRKISVFAGMGTAKNGHIEFKKNQAGVLDALLAAQPDATCDESFLKFREQLNRFCAVEPENPPTTFKGKLRPYQSESLGWFRFLRTCGFGGCLADDMGLGKTVQVLALLESRRKESTKPKSKAKKEEDGAEEPKLPSLIVVPKSLVFNWLQEAERFAPKIRILNHTGGTRTRDHAHFSDYDVVLTTYGTLRNDATNFREVEFDYLILDEAQAVKNASTESAKAVKLLRGRHRLALSGTPIENHIGELWTLFDFINPGMLGAAGIFQQLGSATREGSDEARATLAKALRPFILRRTKDQVAKDLPPKLEQTIVCELESEQRKQYEELRDHYRSALLKTVETEGLNKSKMLVLEALLRLRQAACHPGLIDKSKNDEPSAKLEMLLPRLLEAAEENHKVLVFSQFTSLLSIVRSRLDAAGITYEYLDGKTRDRADRVKNFQENPDCKLFLISLKAGGLGLNLTSAEYVFLLDPWWNPAVEAQAVDRAHRIGQKRKVFAYRLIAKDTVEEKVLQLQQKKKGLADAIINADNSLIRSLSREDLELLLS